MAAVAESKWSVLLLLLLGYLSVRTQIAEAQLTLMLEVPSNQAVVNGQAVEFNCSVSSPDATITWEAVDEGGMAISLTNALSTDTEDNVTTRSLRFGSVGPQQAGNYNCSLLVNGLLVDSETFRLAVITVNGVNDVITSPGNNAMFFCDATGDPDLGYEWGLSSPIDPGMPLDLSFGSVLSRVSGSNTTNLTISSVTYSDTRNNSAMVVCRISLFGQVVNTTSGTFEVFRVAVTSDPMSQSVTEGDTAVFSCTAENTADAPNPLSFEWRVNNNEPVMVGGRVTVSVSAEGNNSNTSNSNTSNSTLTIRNTTRSDIGNYFCLVTNFGPADRVASAPASLTVLFVPVMVEVSVEVNGTALSPVRGQYQVDAGVPTNVVNGRVMAEPPITSAQLLRISNEVNMTGEVINCTLTSTANQFLCTLPAVSVDESGVQFEVVAFNDLGNVTRTITLLVQDIPGPVNLSMLTGDVMDLLRVRLTWIAPSYNNAAITEYFISFCLAENGSLCVPDRTVATNSSGVTFLLEHGAALDSSVRVSVSAQNRVGNGSSVGEPVEIPVATTADATPVNVRTTALTSSFAVVVWDLPSTAMAGDISVNYTVSVGFMSTVSTFNTTSRGVLLDFNGKVTSGNKFEVQVTAEYAMPPDADATTLPELFTVPQVTDVQLLLPNAVLEVVAQPSSITATIRWSEPANREFLERYSIAYESISLSALRRRKRAVMNLDVNLGTSQAVINVLPHSDVSVAVNAVYMGGMSILLLPSITFTSIESTPTAPGMLQLKRDGNTRVNCTWAVPNPPNGIISNYVVTFFIAPGSPRREQVGSSATRFTIINLTPNTNYTVNVIGVTSAGEGAPSETMRIATSFGVSRPGIDVQRTLVNAVFNARFSVTRTDGPLRFYQIIVSRNKIDDTRTMKNIQPYSRDSRSIYVTRVGELDNQQSGATVDIGSGGTIPYEGEQYTNQNLSGNTDYYIFVRVFSSIDSMVYNDSEVFGPIRYNPGLNIAAVIGSIAAVAGILVIILVVLLFVAYCTMASPLKGGGKTAALLRHKNRQQGSLEMRRTRLFSPVLNVGTSDVFTSANQPTTLICEASGTPAPKVSWTRNGEPLDKERFIQLADGSLFINDTDLQDEGAYVVKAVNSVGAEVTEVNLIVTKPNPPEADRDHPIIQVGEFSEKIALLRLDEGLEEEYEEVEPDSGVTSYISQLSINRNKNRYINIIPYDHSRVVLSLQDSTPGSDYINASFVDAYQRPNGYIASQGPMPSTFPDFWRMIWELDVPTIVMVTNLTEDDKVKCHQYWPSFGSKTYGNIQVTLKEVENLAEYSIRTFNVSPLAGQSRVQMPVRELRQFQYLVWPDHGVPTYATNLLSFRKRVLKYHPEKRGPLVVHCSAGVGRTGTFITLDYMLKQIETEGTIDIFNFVRQMRYRRNYMVQTASQYVFIHDALLESIMCGDNSIKAPELKKKVKELREVVSETGISLFETQFKTLEAASPPDEDFDCTAAQIPENIHKNRSESHLPANENRVVLSSDNKQSDYICASFVDNYRERNAFIVTQAPLEETVKDFWRMIWETKSATIVMLTELVEDGEDMCMKYWPSGKDESALFGAYRVELSEADKDRGDYITRKFKLSLVDGGSEESHMVSQFHFTRWSKKLPPKDCRPMIDLIDELQRVQRKSGNMPITVHCDDGIGRTGAFCTLYSVLDRVKTEQIVDVFQAVKTLRIQRTGLMATVSEYEFIHYAVIEFLETFSEYQNFK